MAKITIGADPELYVFNAKDMSPVPAWLLTDAVKNSTPEIIGNKYGVSVHADGTALEFNVAPQTPENFAQAITSAKSVIATFLSSKNKQYRYDTTADFSGYSKEIMKHPLVRLEGCDPDYDAYAANPSSPRIVPPKSVEHLNHRFFGGHIHVGYDHKKCPPWAATRLMDLFILGPMMDYEGHTVREHYYGLPGLFRPKPYGLEYRTPSPFWLRDLGYTVRMASRIGALFSAIEDKTDLIFEFFEATDWQNVKNIFANRRSKEPLEYLRTNARPLLRQIDPQNYFGMN